MPKRVCVTGANGFIAAHVVKQLLEGGHTVRGTVRDPANAKSVSHLTSLPGAAERLELFAADLNRPGSFDAAMQTCDALMHIASPYVLTVKDAQRDLVDPAVNGTLEALRAAAKVPSLKVVVLTSSMAAVTDSPDPTHRYTEDDWNETSTLERNPYYFSKTQAERAAWKFVQDSKPGFRLVALNPPLVAGPSLSNGINTSVDLFVKIFKKQFPGIVAFSWAMVDVRDVAKAHVLAMENDQAKGRYLCANVTVSMRELVAMLRSHNPKNQWLPSASLEGRFGSALVLASTLVVPKGDAVFARTNLGRPLHFDNSRIRRDLGLEFRAIEQTVNDTVDDLVKNGHI